MGEQPRLSTGNVPKIVLFGSTGMVGSDFTGDILRPRLDATKLDALKFYLYRERPKYVINAIGMPRFCDKDPYKCNQLNVVVPINLVTVCNEIGAKLIHFSSTLAGSYNLYARSKDYSDYYVENFCKDYAIIKIGWMFGLRNDLGFVKTVKECIYNNQKVTVYDEVGVASYTVDVDKYIIDNIDTIKGTVVVANKGVCSKKEFAEEILKFYKSDLAVDYSQRKEQYKKDSYLEGQLRDWREALRECLCDREFLHQN